MHGRMYIKNKNHVRINGRQAYIWTRDLQNTTNFYAGLYSSIVSELKFRWF